MKIIFEKIRWKNFLSTGDSFTEFELNNVKKTLIIGKNGSGKSTLLCALCFALYNKPFRDINKPDIINSTNKKGLLVECWFTIGTQKYKVRRGIKPNIFEIYLNDDMIDQNAASSDLQEFLEKEILKINYNAFNQIVILGKASYVPFMKLKTPQRREIIDQLLDLSVITKINTLLKERVSNNNKEISSTTKDLEIQKEGLKIYNHYLEEQKKNTTVKIEANEEEIKSLEEENNKIVKFIEQKQSEISELEKQIQDQSEVTKQIQQYNDYDREYSSKNRNLREEIKFFEKNDHCPTCTQEIDIEFKKKEISKKQEKSKKIEEGLSRLYVKREECEKRLKEIGEISSSLSKVQSLISNANSKISSNNSLIQRLNTEIRSLMKEKDEKKPDESNYEEKILEIGKTLKELENTKEVYDLAAEYLKDKGIKAHVIKNYIGAINENVNKYLSLLDFFCGFELDENFNETIKLRHYDNLSYNSFSEGEKLRIDLALMFTWREIAKLRNSINTNLLLMDEIFDGSMDNDGCSEFLKLLSQLTNNTNTFIISHRGDSLVDHFDKIYEFEKIQQFSICKEVE